jgi:hypothetical protein
MDKLGGRFGHSPSLTVDLDEIGGDKDRTADEVRLSKT